LQGWAFQELFAVAQVAPCFATPPNALPLAKTTDLQLAWAGKRPWTMPGEMLAPHAPRAQTFYTSSLHLFAFGCAPLFGAVDA
jgi:hypothetical protein